VEDRLDVLPGARDVRVRAVESAGARVDAALPGRRVALNVLGAGAHQLHRGDVVVRAEQWHPASTFDAEVQVLAHRAAPLTRRGAHLLAIGSAEHAVRVRVLDGDALAPGARGFVRVHLPVPLPLVPGDRFVLRDAGRDELVGGGEVLEVDPLLPAARARPDREVARIVAERGWIDAGELSRRVGRTCTPDVGRWRVHEPVRVAAVAALRDRLAAAGAIGVDLASLDEREQALLAQLDGVHTQGTRATLTDDDPLVHEPWLGELRRHLFDPPPPEGVDATVLRDLVASGHVVRLTPSIHVAREAIDAAVGVITALGVRHPDGLTVSHVRDALASSRRVVVPLLEHLATTGRTIRTGDRHLAAADAAEGRARLRD
jgi:selenocysteine-specific elongation factor